VAKSSGTGGFTSPQKKRLQVTITARRSKREEEKRQRGRLLTPRIYINKLGKKSGQREAREYQKKEKSGGGGVRKTGGARKKGGEKSTRIEES